MDLDGAVSFLEVPPASLAIDEAELARRRPPAEVTKALRQRYAVVAGRVTPVFVPLWRIVLGRAKGAGFRVVLIDAITGQGVDWA